MNFSSTLDKIQADAAELQPSRVGLTIVAAPLFAVGWAAAKTWAVIWLVITWVMAATVVGWKSGKGKV